MPGYRTCVRWLARTQGRELRDRAGRNLGPCRTERVGQNQHGQRDHRLLPAAGWQRRGVRRGHDADEAASHRHARCRTHIQNLALFRGMTVLENILLGRHIHMRAGALPTLFYWVWALRNEVANRRIVEEL